MSNSIELKLEFPEHLARDLGLNYLDEAVLVRIHQFQQNAWNASKEMVAEAVLSQIPDSLERPDGSHMTGRQIRNHLTLMVKGLNILPRDVQETPSVVN